MNKEVEKRVVKRKLYKQTKYGYVMRIPTKFIDILRWQAGNYNVTLDNDRIIIEKSIEEEE